MNLITNPKAICPVVCRLKVQFRPLDFPNGDFEAQYGK
jgi:hypothetical protein